MKRHLYRVIATTLLAGFAGTGSAQNLDALTGALGGLTGDPASLGPQTLVQSLNNVDDAANALVTGQDVRGGGLRAAALAALDPDSPQTGNVTQMFNNGNAAFQGFAIRLADGTPALPLAFSYRALTNTGYSLLLPVYQQMDGPAQQLAAAGSPLTTPLSQAIDGATFDLTLDFPEVALPMAGTAPVPGDLPLGAFGPESLTMLLDELPLSGLPM